MTCKCVCTSIFDLFELLNDNNIFMQHFFSKILVLGICCVCFCTNSFAQCEEEGFPNCFIFGGDETPPLAEPTQLANALYINCDIVDSSNQRRRNDIYPPELLYDEWNVSRFRPFIYGGDMHHRTGGGRFTTVPWHTTQTFYLTSQLPYGYWWYISNDSLVKYYDDMITIYFNQAVKTDTLFIMVFDACDAQVAVDTVFIDPRTELTAGISPGEILTGNQHILHGQTPVNLIATAASGGTCNSSEPAYQWQRSYDSINFANIGGATLDSLVTSGVINELYELHKSAVALRRRVICGTDTAYAGPVFIYIADSLQTGTVSPAEQTVNASQYPATLHSTTAKNGACGGAYTYKWQFSNDNLRWTDMNDQVTDSLHFDTYLSNSVYYRLAVFCGTETVYSNAVVVNVNGTSVALKPGANNSLPSLTVTPKKLPAAYEKVPAKYNRVYVPTIPIQDSANVNMSAAVEDVNVATSYFDSYGRTLQTITKQTSPLKKDNVVPALYDAFGRSPVSYLPYTSDSANGKFRLNPFQQDSAFYKSMFPYEKIIYGETSYDGSPFNIPLSQRAQGNSWQGSGRGKTMQYRTNATYDSVRLWTIAITGEDDTAHTTGYYVAGSLSVAQVTDEDKMTVVKYTNELGQTVMTKTMLQSCLVSGQAKWLYTYYVYDEMNHLRMVIPPKAVAALKTGSVNWNLSADSINSNLCYEYYYDELGRAIMKRIPGKGKSYIAYDIMNRVVMSQDAHLRSIGQWTFVLYDGQSRPVRSGVITTSLLKDSIWAQASRSSNYPTLSGTYTITSENYYDDYSWIAATSAPVSDSINKAHINSTNFNTSYNNAPDYAQELKKSVRIRGAVTGSKRIVLNTTDYLYTVNFYDDRGRAIQTQQTNYSGGTDVSTIQYSYSGKILRSFLQHEKAGTNAQTHTVLTKYSYDHMGRVLSITKNFDSLGDKRISKLKYNELGRVSQKVIGDSLETQNYTYNIRGWILGLNEDYARHGSSIKTFFGEALAYDSGYTNSHFNGNISGIRWRAVGDRVQRSYGYAYDNANRLSFADFYQLNAGDSGWTKDKVDYTVSNLSYDEAGNILSMKQRGLLVGSSATIDSLVYDYYNNSNFLKKVSDGMPAHNALGDFTDTTSAGDDYAYDINGNTVKDNNRHLHAGSNPGAAFNLLDKPDSMLIAGKSKTKYYYDAAGATLRKTINDSILNLVKNYEYIGGFVYLNDTLQYALTEEGRIRYAKKRNASTGDTYYAYEYDYFIKDHQANVRAVITEEKDTAFYQATMEPARMGTEDALFANIYTPVNTVSNKPSGFDSDTANHKVSKLNGSISVNVRMGPSMVLKVMTGDKVQINTYAFYNTTTAAPQSGVNLLSDILSMLPGSIIGSSGNKLLPANSSALSGVLSPNVSQFLTNNNTYNTSKPKAFLNWILFDEQFNFIASNSGVEQVQPGTEKQALVAPLQTISKNGFLYIYVSNESPQDVYFDDLTVTHYSGPLIQEQSYYPFGLEMAGISSRAALRSLSAYKYNAGSELEDEGGLNYYNTFFRKYDAQIGRFNGVDMKAESFAGITPFQFGNNNPVFYNDPMGDKFVNIRLPDPVPNIFYGLTHSKEFRMKDDGFMDMPYYDNANWDGGSKDQSMGGGGGGNPNGVSWGISVGENITTFSGGLAALVFKELFGEHSGSSDNLNIDVMFNSDWNMVGAFSFYSNDPSPVQFAMGERIIEADDEYDRSIGIQVRMRFTDFTGKYTNLNFLQIIGSTENGKTFEDHVDKLVEGSRYNFYYAQDDETDDYKKRISTYTTNDFGVHSVRFYDSPVRSETVNINWHAELSVVGMINGVYQPIYSIRYWYSASGGNVNFYNHSPLFQGASDSIYNSLP